MFTEEAFLVTKDWTNVTRTIHTPEGNLLISGTTSPQTLSMLNMDLQLKSFRPAKRQKAALMEISELTDGKVVTAQLNGDLVGYITFHPPDEFERWSQGPKKVLELGAIEVSPVVRKYGIARNMLEVAFEDPVMEDYIVLATEYYWHWDLEGTGMHIWEYREMMRRLMEHVHLVVKDTDDEEISSHPANMLMVRYGKNVSTPTIRAFEQLLFSE
ncbi:MAG: GNAT family N-acetyltransferase [Peptococcaceae bacterium]|nr:GNAT family N-acetyltransferase [Peptococcaceae bacterium]